MQIMTTARLAAPIAFFLLLFGSTVAQGQTATGIGTLDARIAKVDALMRTFADYGQFSGAVLVAEKGKLLYKHGFGLANREWNEPNSTLTKFRLASVTKQFTAMLILQLAAEGKVALDLPIASYLPDYPKANAERITLHHLLAHTSGTPNFTSFPSYRDNMAKHNSPEDLMGLFAEMDLEFAPGERFSYSNSGYVVLGAIVERITGMSYAQALQERIFIPLGMVDSGVDDTQAVLERRASGYERNGSTFTQASYIDMSTPFSAGAIYSTVEDMYLWDQALYTDKLLPKTYRDRMFQPQVPTGGGGSYGYGWGIGELPMGNGGDLSQSQNHSGGINGFHTWVVRIPADSIYIVLLNNTGSAPLYTAASAINGILHDKPYDMPKRSLANTVLATMESDGIERAVADFNKKKGTVDHYLDETEMNIAGYALLRSGKQKEAAALFKLNVESFPNSFNVFDSYGEVLLAMGDTAEAIANYTRSVQLNPDNTNGIQVLQGLGVDTDALIMTIPAELMPLYIGTYKADKETTTRKDDWTIVIAAEEGQLYGQDADYRYKMVPTGENAFVNPDDGATVVFDTSNKKAISFVIFGKVTFRKVK